MAYGEETATFYLRLPVRLIERLRDHMTVNGVAISKNMAAAILLAEALDARDKKAIAGRPLRNERAL